MEGRIAMKINGPKDIGNLDELYGEKRVKKSESAEAELVGQRGELGNSLGDVINISPKAIKMQEYKSLIEQIPDMREEEVKAIKEEVDSGRYQVDSDKIAHAIIRDNMLNHLL